jgi:multisubunit Na+/H+ antiporter MnhB subunit
MRASPTVAVSPRRDRQRWHTRWWVWTIAALLFALLILLALGKRGTTHEYDGILYQFFQRMRGAGVAPKSPPG